jgi:hypothetical protein
MRINDKASKTQALNKALTAYEANEGNLLGIRLLGSREAWLAQIVSSIRRIEYVSTILSREIAADRSNPHSLIFDPIKSAALLGRIGKLDEAVWMTFIATNFGKHVTDGWKLAANVIGSFGVGTVWTAENYSAAPNGFDSMLLQNAEALRDRFVSGMYSNHRRYQSKKPEDISRAFTTFYNWQFSNGGFRQLLVSMHKRYGQEPTGVFDALYNSLESVHGLGRLGKFDFLTMLGKLQLAPIEPGSAYLTGATGPLAGARLLFAGDRLDRVPANELEDRIRRLDQYLNVGMQVIEDSLCNWQKAPDRYVYFRG